MSELKIKKIKVNGEAHQIDYEALANLPFRKVNIVNYVEDSSKDDHRPKKDHAYGPVQYDDGGTQKTKYVIDSVEIFRYACPEQIDIDSTIGEGNLDTVLEPELHKKYIQDGRQMYARDGDFGYPEIDGTGQFNFRPNFNETGYVLRPVVTDSDNKVHNDVKEISSGTPNPDYNPCYNNFKTPWLTGIEGVYRFTKICKDINIDLQVVKESDIAANEILYKIVAPADYEGSIPKVRVFRSGDQAEKYFKYYLKQNWETKYPALSENCIKGEELTFVKQETEANEPQEWHASGITYDDSTGYPESVNGKVVFLIDDSLLPEGYTCTPSIAPAAGGVSKPVGAGDYGLTKQVTKINGNQIITITIAPPVSISYNNDGHLLTYPDTNKDGELTGETAVCYGFNIPYISQETGLEATYKGYAAAEVPTSAAQGSSPVITLIHGESDTDHPEDPSEGRVGAGWAEVGPKGAKFLVKNPTAAENEWVRPTDADVYPYIASVTVDGSPISVASAIASVTWTTKKAKITLSSAATAGDVVITLAERPTLE